MQIPIDEIKVKNGRRELNIDHAHELADSIRELGLLNPITIDQDHDLIAGLHRLEAVKLLGWSEVECTVSSLAGLQAELAEIDENFVRNGFSTLEYGEMLLRRKEIYEMLHPETKAGVAQAVGMNISVGNNVGGKMHPTSKSFVQDTAEKLGVHPSTVKRQIQTAKNLTPETKEIIKGADAKISKKAALKLSRLEPEQQQEAATLWAAKEIKSVDEYKAAKPTAPASEPETVESEPPAPFVPFVLPSKHFATFRESVADLKDPNKDCSCSADVFLAEFSSFSKKFIKEIEWYNIPHYEVVFPSVTARQFEYLREVADSMHTAIESLLNLIERMQNNELQEKSLPPIPQEA